MDDAIINMVRDYHKGQKIDQPNQRFSEERTLLHMIDDPKYVKLLLDSGANPNLFDATGSISLHLNARKGIKCC